MHSLAAGIAVIIVAATCLGACSLRGAARDTGPRPLEAYIDQVRRATGIAIASRPRSVMPTAESSDPELSRALSAVRMFPSSERHLEVGLAYQRLGILDKAHEHFSLAAGIDPRNAMAHAARARVWRDVGLLGRALADAHRAVFHAPDCPVAHNTLGTVLQALGRWVEARAEYDRTVALHPGAAYALNNLCSLDLLEGEPARAARTCQQALALQPSLDAARQNLDRANAALATTGGSHARQ